MEQTDKDANAIHALHSKSHPKGPNIQNNGGRPKIEHRRLDPENRDEDKDRQRQKTSETKIEDKDHRSELAKAKAARQDLSTRLATKLASRRGPKTRDAQRKI